MASEGFSSTFLRLVQGKVMQPTWVVSFHRIWVKWPHCSNPSMLGESWPYRFSK